MKLLVISDSHGKDDMLEMILERENDSDYLIHLGDGANDMASLLRYTVNKRVYLTQGNCDLGGMGRGLAPQHVFTVEGVTVLACHGHRYNVKLGLQNLYYAGLQENARICLFGHTHYQQMGDVEGMLLLNPGAAHDGRYAVITIENGKITPVLKHI